MFKIGDRVRIIGTKDVFTVVGTRGGDMYELQLGNDGASKRFENGANLELVAKAATPESEPRFVPKRSITDVGY